MIMPAERLTHSVLFLTGEVHALRLAKHGLKETEASIANKISRGTFSATFLLATLIAIEAEVVRLENI